MPIPRHNLHLPEDRYGQLNHYDSGSDAASND